MSINLDLAAVDLDTLSKLAIFGGFIFTGVTFFITRRGLKHAEQVKMAHDVSKELADAENEALNISHIYPKQIKNRQIQYLNVWEWFAFLVNHKEINDKVIIDHFKPTLIRDYETILENYDDLKTNENEFKEIKLLYKKWKSHTGDKNRFSLLFTRKK